MEATGPVDESDELRSTFLRSAAALNALPLGLKAQLSSMAKPGRLREDRCQVCGLRLDALEVKLKTTAAKLRKVKLMVICSGCKSVSYLPLPGRTKQKEILESRLKEKAKKKIKPVQLPVLTKTEKRSSKASRLAKLAASMAKEEEKKVEGNSSLAAFLKSLSN